jgi:phage terminase large subunit-like protein
LQEVYDFEVEKYHNYYAGWMIHHNTECGIAEDIAHMLGYRPWLDESDPDFRIDIKVPNQGLIGCETMMHSVPQKIEPTLKRLIPKMCKPVFKPGPTGVPVWVQLTYDTNGKKCGSKAYIRSYDQRPDTYEGNDYDWVHWDEPPPEAVHKAAERGKVSSNAPSWYTMTPLKEPYIYDQFSLKAGVDPEIWTIRGEIWENCRDWCKACDVTIEENLYERAVRFCPKCHKTMGFIPRQGIEEYLKTLDPEEREAREKGLWKHLSGLVYKELDRDVHIYKDFPIPKNWMKIEGFDPHDARPTCWIFGAISPEEIEIFGKTRHRIYFYDHLSLKGDLDEFVAQIRSRRELHGYSDPTWVVMDAKFGQKTQIENKSWRSELEKRGIHHIIESHSSPGDVDLGHKIVREYLKSQYSSLIGQAKPGMLFAEEGCGGEGGPIWGMFRYQYRTLGDKPEEKYKDWPDTVRYIAMEQPAYRSPKKEAEIEQTIRTRMSKAIEQRRAYA